MSLEEKKRAMRRRFCAVRTRMKSRLFVLATVNLTPSPSLLRNSQNPSSMLTFEGEQFQGSENILGKLKGIGGVTHQVKSMDVQPSASGNAIVIFVTGSVRIGDPNANPLHFCEMFQLVSTGPNAYYVHNDVFRLNYGL